MGQFLLVLAVALTVGAIVFAVATLIAGGSAGLRPAEPDGCAVPLPANRPLAEQDVRSVRFDTALRGYRMAQVDEALQRAAYDIGYKDELIEVLQAEVEALRAGRLPDAEVLRRAREAALASVAAEEVAAEEVAAVDEAPAEEVPAEEVPAEEAPAEEAPVDEAPAEEAPVDEAPVDEALVEEAPVVGEVPATEGPVEDAVPAEASSPDDAGTDRPGEATAGESAAERVPAPGAPSTLAPPDTAVDEPDNAGDDSTVAMLPAEGLTVADDPAVSGRR